METVTEVGISHPDIIDLADSIGPLLGTVIASFGCRRSVGLNSISRLLGPAPRPPRVVRWVRSRFKTKGEVVSTTGWIILIVVLLILFGGGFGWSRRRR